MSRTDGQRFDCIERLMNETTVLSIRYVCLCWIYNGVTELAFVSENIICFDMKQGFSGVQ